MSERKGQINKQNYYQTSTLQVISHNPSRNQLPLSQSPELPRQLSDIAVSHTRHGAIVGDMLENMTLHKPLSNPNIDRKSYIKAQSLLYKYSQGSRNGND
jgi:hypothetical protein